ncbi:hypothetical protein [Shewanella gelidii]|uniref:DUF3828 domain-containing protein n=1 Tax=Shewanella gelidii TaxID=1642821 RepID=A0A917JW50_9GAMM|nr:hypothetical protein [Shewanella gelidii]MCL1097917.1 hypothetical protein [Shewanella gelidii]GGI84665.1 hypothetical protein GCM10009332_22490 [Shewanella gelidii]
MKYSAKLIILIYSLSFSVLGQNQMTASDVTGFFLNEMKNKEYFNASEYVSQEELSWLKNSTIPLLKNDEFLDSFELDKLSDQGISDLTESEIFALWSMLVWERRDKSFGSFQPANVLGEVSESEKVSHVVVRDIVNPIYEAVVYTLVNENGSWKIKLPRIIRGTVTIYQRVST